MLLLSLQVAKRSEQDIVSVASHSAFGSFSRSALDVSLFHMDLAQHALPLAKANM